MLMYISDHGEERGITIKWKRDVSVAYLLLKADSNGREESCTSCKGDGSGIKNHPALRSKANSKDNRFWYHQYAYFLIHAPALKSGFLTPIRIRSFRVSPKTITMSIHGNAGNQ